MEKEEITKNPKFKKDSAKKALRIFKYIRPYMWYFVTGMIFLVLSSLLFMGLMGLPGEMANIALGKPKFNLGLSVKDFGWIFLIILILQGVFSYLRTYLFAVVSEKGMADLRIRLYQKIITQPIHFFEERRVGELTSRITTDVEQLQSVFSVTLGEFIRQIVVLIAGIIIIIVWTPKLSMIMLMTFPAIVISAMFFGKYIKQLSRQRQDELAHTNTIVEETFQSFAIVKAFANEWYEVIRYSKSVEKIVSVSLSFAKMRGLFFTFIITILFGGIFFILWQGALLLERHEMEAGDLFSFIMYTGILGGAIASLGTLSTQILTAIGATERILDILECDSELDIQDNASEGEALHVKGNIVYNNISFAYPTRKDLPVLKDINMHIKAGQRIALVGQSGAGKSTLTQLLLKFYKPDSGTITVDDLDINDMNLTHYRNNLAIVPQEVILFGGSIRENISYGKPGASESEIIEAARQSNSLEFIHTFPEGLDTIVGDRGIKLSGGQRQRIAIARALLKNPKILILDEATSSLDAESERLVQEALDVLMVNRTSIIIAHRLATIKDVDWIYVIDNGVIAEQGTHSDLIEIKNGVYASLAKLQFENT
ncbi:MAG TPA: ABC transporter transmembrane domain-containing protein [Saprospiraceae bacterium]|nr:ATP-binding cassette domain-containing protein [Saprospiraceae bacterium]HRO08731.1 ABC transporter transmembrane domain-containing protein [Saprospiraceae bacterium]HRP42042.1 ABC transporter transmembrane domain-containing protein [Saprospiraceae bacterium]